MTVQRFKSETVRQTWRDKLDKFLWSESKRIADKNDREGTWIDGDEMDRLMVGRGIFTAEELRLQDS